MRLVECYTGNLSENIKDALPKLLCLRKTRENDILLIWNEVHLWIESDSTYESVLSEYRNKLDM